MQGNYYQYHYFLKHTDEGTRAAYIMPSVLQEWTQPPQNIGGTPPE